MWTIYCHTHAATGRRYIGQTKLSWQRRWKGHLANARRSLDGYAHFGNALRKYGADAFSHEVLESCSTQDEADVAERRWIAEFDTTNRDLGFNRKPGGQGDNNEALRNAKNKPENRAKVAVEAAARWADPAFKAKTGDAISEAQTAAHAANPERRVKSAAKMLTTKAEQNAARDHVDCDKHGRIELADCYMKTRNGFRVLACAACVLDAQKAKRDAFRAEHPIVAPTTFHCKVHGELSFDDCYKRVLPDGRVWRRCKACTLETNRGGPKQPPRTSTKCVKCGNDDRFKMTDGSLGDCRVCHHERAKARRAAAPKRELGTPMAPRVDTSDRPAEACEKCKGTRRLKPRKGQRLGDCLDCHNARARAKRAAARAALTNGAGGATVS